MFQKSLMSTFVLNVSPRTEILATPLQYRTWEEFMYEIVFWCSPSNQNPGAAPVYSILVYCIFISCHLCPHFQIFIRGGPHVWCGLPCTRMYVYHADKSQNLSIYSLYTFIRSELFINFVVFPERYSSKVEGTSTKL